MKLNNVVKSSYKVDEKITPKEDITTYNNYYEFGTGKDDPARYANTLRPSPGKCRWADWWTNRRLTIWTRS